jgi:hypothetical protein
MTRNERANTQNKRDSTVRYIIDNLYPLFYPLLFEKKTCLIKINLFYFEKSRKRQVNTKQNITIH